MANYVRACFLIFVVLIVLQTPSSSFCPLRFPTIGSLQFQDLTSCGSFYSTFLHTMEFCQDLCMRSQPDCKSFNYGCGKQPLKLNCRLFNFTISELIGRSHNGACKIESPPKNCFHENLDTSTYEAQKENC